MSPRQETRFSTSGYRTETSDIGDHYTGQRTCLRSSGLWRRILLTVYGFLTCYTFFTPYPRNPPIPPYIHHMGHTATPTLYTDSVGDTEIPFPPIGGKVQMGAYDPKRIGDTEKRSVHRNHRRIISLNRASPKVISRSPKHSASFDLITPSMHPTCNQDSTS